MAPVRVFAVLAALLPALAAQAKTSACSDTYDSQIRAQFFDGASVSPAKVDAYIQLLRQKRSEIAAIDVSKLEMKGDKKGKDPKKKKVAKALDKSKSLFALDTAIAQMQSMKSPGVTMVQACDIAGAVTDIEDALKVQGDELPIEDMIDFTRAILHTWKIKKQQTASEEASNLWDPATKQYLSQADIAARLARGEDLSLLEPGPGSVFYVPQRDVSRVDVRAAAMGKYVPMFADINPVYPAQDTYLYDGVKRTDTVPKIDGVVENGGPKGKFKLKFGSEYNADPTADAIMMTLGFPADINKYAQHFKLVMPAGKTLDTLKHDWEAYYTRDKLRQTNKIEDAIENVSKDSQGRVVVTFKEGSIEAHPEAITRVGGWVYGDADHVDRREVRGMTLVQNWLDNSDLKEFDNSRVLLRKNNDGSVSRLDINSDVGHTLGWLFLETPSMYMWDMVSSTSGSTIDLNYRGFNPVSIRNKMTLSDARWAARLIARLTREQIATAVALGGWPSCVQKEYVERMISRRNNLIQALGLVGARQNDGSVIQLLPVTSDRKAFDIENVCSNAPNKSAVVEHYGYDVGTFIDPILLGLKETAFGLANTALGAENRVEVLDPRKFNLDTRGIVEVLVSKGRDLELNPKSKTADDLYIAKEHLEVGLRLGVSFGLYADAVVWTRYELAYPTRSPQTENMTDGFLRTLLLPKQMRDHGLPDSFVLMTEHQLEKNIGIQADDIFSPVTPEIQAYRGRVSLWRSIYDHRDGKKKAVLYRDRADFNQADLDVWLRLGLFKTSVFRELQQWGAAKGRGVILKSSDLESPVVADAVTAAVKSGDFSGLAAKEKQFSSTDQFEQTLRKWNLLIFSQTINNRLDEVTIDTPDKTENRVEFSSSRGEKVSFLSSAVTKNVRVEVFADPQHPSQMEMQVNVVGTDVKTVDSEMQNKYLHFINGLSLDGRPLIPLTVGLHYTTNGSWGNTLTQSNTTYSTGAVARFLAMSDADFMTALHASATAAGEDNRSVTSHGEDFLKRLAAARATPLLADKVKMLAEAVRKATFIESAGFFSPSVLGALNRIAGADLIYSRNLITVPDPLMVNLPEGTPLFAKIGTKPAHKVKYLVYSPQTPVDLYTMFDTWF